MEDVLKELEKISLGFICVTVLKDHYTNASHRIFILNSTGVITIFWFENEKKILCKSKKFLNILKSNKFLKKFI